MIYTGAVSSFFHLYSLQNGANKMIKTVCIMPQIRDVNDRPLLIAGSLNQVVHIGNKVYKVTFFVSILLVAPVILGCDIFGNENEEIWPRQRTIFLDD